MNELLRVIGKNRCTAVERTKRYVSQELDIKVFTLEPPCLAGSVHKYVNIVYDIIYLKTIAPMHVITFSVGKNLRAIVYQGV